MPYTPYRSELFAKQLKDLCKKDKPLGTRLEAVISGILTNPENFDSPLQGNRNRSVKKKAVSEHYRIIYRYCERCLQIHKELCKGCTVPTKDENLIIFEEVFHRDDGY